MILLMVLLILRKESDMARDIVRLSKNFALSEMTKSATAERLGVDNTPSLIHLVNLTHLAINILQPVRDKFGVITINSGYRSPTLNAKVVDLKPANIVMVRLQILNLFLHRIQTLRYGLLRIWTLTKSS